jgi:transcriptional regulator with XRE-family HTH domain
VTVATTVSFSPDKFIDAMREADYRPDELAKEMGASHEAVGRWMAGIASPKPGYAELAARILGVKVSDFYE